MNPTAPQIGFDRFIHLDWAEAALRVRAGLASISVIDERLDSADLGIAAKKKTRTVLNRLWIAPRTELVGFADRGARLFSANPEISPAILTWGMAIASYPFFGKVAELVGRLSALQGDCTSAELHRRMSEIYGEREGTYRMTNMVVQTQANWGALQRIENEKRLVKKPAIKLQNESVISWIIEAAVRHTGKALSVATLQSVPVLYPFVLDSPVSFVVSNSDNLELRSEGTRVQFVALRG